jgi:CRP-like cAMP-binding protein
MSLTSLAGHLAYALIACSFLVRDLFWLRCISVVGSFAAIVFNFYAPAEPLWLVIYWNVAFASLNIIQIFRMVRERSSVKFTDEERDLFGTLFQGFSPVEFMKLLRIAHWEVMEPGQILTNEGQPVANLMLIYDGEVEVVVGGRSVTTLKGGRFLGEISFIAGGNASATTKIAMHSRLVVWPKDELQALLTRNPTLRFAFHSVLHTDLARKLQRDSLNNEAHLEAGHTR